MKTKRLKKFVLPTVYVLSIITLFVSISYLSTILNKTNDYSDLVVDSLIDNTTPVVSTQNAIVKPFTSTSVSISKSFYDMTDDEEKQQNSLIYYEKTYMQNSGVLYSSSESFDLIATYDGTITNIDSDDILGNFIEITHNTNLKTIYYGVGEILVSKDDTVKSGDIIAKSGTNKIDSSNNSLLFEVYLNGYAIDPEDYYNMSAEDLV